MTRLRDLDAAWFREAKQETDGNGAKGLALLEHAVETLRDLDDARGSRDVSPSVWADVAADHVTKALDKEVWPDE